MSSDLTFITNGDTFLNARHPDHKVDFMLANHASDWGGERLRDKSAWKET